MQAGIAKTRKVTREEALQKVVKVRDEQEEGRQHRLIVEYDRRSSHTLAKVLAKNYQQMVRRDPRMGTIFKKIPRPNFRRGNNVKDLL